MRNVVRNRNRNQQNQRSRSKSSSKALTSSTKYKAGVAEQLPMLEHDREQSVTFIICKECGTTRSSILVHCSCAELKKQSIKQKQSKKRIRARPGSSMVSIVGTGAFDPFGAYPIETKPYMHKLISHSTNLASPVAKSLSNNGARNPYETIWLASCIQSPAFFHGQLLVASGNISSLSGAPAITPRTIYHRNEVMRLVSDALQRKEVTDDILAATVCLSGFDAQVGSMDTWSTHILGVADMVKMRGGLEKLGFYGLLRDAICWSDQVHSAMTGKETSFPHANRFTSALSPPSPPENACRHSEIGSSVSASTQMGTLLDKFHNFNSSGKRIQLLHETTDPELELVIDTELEESHEAVPANLSASTRKILVRFYLLCLDAVLPGGEMGLEPQLIRECSDLKVQIYSDRYPQIVPTGPIPTMKEEMRRATIRTRLATYLEALAETLTWALFMGGTVAKGPARSWFIASLQNVSHQSGIRSWNATARTLARYLTIGRLPIDACRKLWLEVQRSSVFDRTSFVQRLPEMVDVEPLDLYTGRYGPDDFFSVHRQAFLLDWVLSVLKTDKSAVAVRRCWRSSR
ncbi:MAG: hypothetical protein M1827_000696 [Pycnora praestabilis]|nr:MAG: hypothetical protein M1827_000696 [Pycnora praestabilis]